MRKRVAAAAVILLLSARAELHAQAADGFMARVAAAWRKSDAEAVSLLGDQAGIAIEVDGRHVGSIAPRQAAAVLRRVFADRESLSAVAGTARTMPGNARRAYAEIVWEYRVRGTTQPVKANVFIAAARDGAAWRITEIRLMQ
ncbi:MAG TPA: hypothetical protein VF035_05825 [Longimicrobiales bacterium]